MKKLLEAYKSLPPEMKMLIALAGLGTPSGLVYVLHRYLGLSYVQVIVGMFVVVAVVCLVSFLISKIFGAGGRKRSRRMEAELSRSAEASPVSMDLRAAIKANTEKYFDAIRDMRKNLRISVYDLPWYIVIGDSGCGKTKLVNEGGLTFSTGKPEGYQLGTLNYNWWFTEDAVFVDMAGRLCNPQDDADRREWTAFLDTIAKGRKGFPINGAIVCVSAEHLIQDSPEKHEQDANTVLERLRDLQSKLGVTFATYLVITKCDKILGFMQFFDRAERDITMKNQIFGWSRPGEFGQLYDPETFGRDFDGVYGRLNELRLRRLNDDADEIELGLAYSFPEEFRQLREPLQIYMRTLFPMIKNPRAVKNLIFRGVYFTSATQQGAVILKHLVERLGADAAGQFAPLESLYPQPRPHFVKDLLFRKVFPEQGLVFRNEQQVIRNRKLSRLLKVGSVGLALVLVGALTWSALTFGNLIGQPRQNALGAPAKVEAPNVALAGAQSIATDVERLGSRPWPARVLSLGIGAGKPIEDLTTIQIRLFEEGVLRKVLTDVDQALRTTKLADPRGGADAVKAAAAYQASLEQYIRWAGCRGSEALPGDLKFDGFEKLCAVVSDPASPVKSKEFRDQAGAYFTKIHDPRGLWKRNPARLLAEDRFKPPETIRLAVINVHNHLAGYATLTEDHPDPTVREWMRLRKAGVEVAASYDEMLQSATREVGTQKELADFQAAFIGAYDRFEKALAACAWQGGGNPVRIGGLRDALRTQRQQWVQYQGQLRQAAEKQQPQDPAVLEPIQWLAGGDPSGSTIPGLDLVLAKNLKDTGLSERNYFDGFFGDDFNKLVSEVHERDGHVLALQVHKESFDPDRIVVTPQAQWVQGVLKNIRDQLAAARFDQNGDLSKEVPSAWIPQLDRVLSGEDKEKENPAPEAKPPADLNTQWRPPDLAALQSKYKGLIARGEGTRLLSVIAARLEQGGEWGLAELYPNWREKSPSSYQIKIPEAAAAPRTAAETRPERPDIRRPDRGSSGVRRPGDPAPNRPPPEPEPRPSGIDLEGVIPACATHAFLNDRAWDCVQLVIYLQQFTPEHFLPGAGEYKELNQLCVRRLAVASQKYADTYVKSWHGAYERKQLPKLQRLREQARSWAGLAQSLGDRRSAADADPREIGKEIQAALQEILEALPWASYHSERGSWKEQERVDREWSEPSTWLALAMKNHWPADAGRFVHEAQIPGGAAGSSVRPWLQAAGEFARAWQELTETIVANGALPQTFDSKTRECTEIPWSRFERLRKDMRLEDEKLTGQLVAFVRESQNQLSRELSSAVAGIQQRHLGSQAPYDGWPYLNPAGSADSALETVNYAGFKAFLIEIARAEKVFAALEKGLPEDAAGRGERLAFYAASQAWLNFLSLDAQGEPAALGVEVWNEDPLNPSAPGGKEQGIDDTAQLYYKRVDLTLGLTVEDPAGGRSEGPLKIPLVPQGQEGRWQTRWRWIATAGQVKMQLAEGIMGEGKSEAYPTLPPQVLGSSSPLAFCAYLHRYGRYDRAKGVWVSAHAIDLAAALQSAGKANLIPSAGRARIGAKFGFRLDRALPAPVAPLSPPGS